MNMITMIDDYNGILLDSQGNTSNITINGDLMFNSRTGEFVNVIRNGYSNIMTDFNGEVYNVQYRKQVKYETHCKCQRWSWKLLHTKKSFRKEQRRIKYEEH